MGSHRFSIRQKFLVAPAIGLVLIAVLVGAGRYVLDEREAYLRHLLEEDLVAAGEVDRAYQQLSTPSEAKGLAGGQREGHIIMVDTMRPSW